jgi:hypothetical protein
MGYKNDQFYNLPQEEYRIRMGDGSTRTNKAFGYPDNKVRTYTRDGNRLVPVNTTLKRGYIRSLQNVYQSGPTTKTTLPILRCDFQFNPATLQQAVQMRQDILNMFQQDPVQVTQPLAGQASFGFQLFFDRTFTYNNERDVNSAPEEGGGYDIANIGVLHDVRLLYSIIGQGINEDMITVALNSARNTLAAEAATANNEASDPSRTDTTSGASDVGLGVPDNFNDLANSFFNANFGNTAFLIPLPVRAVFSSLYMVDGYVTSSSIIFTKFSTTYVPLQCMVTLNMQAMYLGFAKKDTFLSLNLDDARKKTDQAIATNKKAIEDFSKVVSSFSPKIETSLIIQNAPDVRAGDRGQQRVSVNRRIASLVTGETDKTIRKLKLKMIDNTEGTTEALVALFDSTPSGMSVSVNTYIEVYELPANTDRDKFLELTRSNRKPPDEVSHAATLTSVITINTSEELKKLFSSGTVTDASYYNHKKYSSSFIVDFYNNSNVQFFVLYRNSLTIKLLNENFTYQFDQVEDSGTLSKEISEKPRQSRPSRR